MQAERDAQVGHENRPAADRACPVSGPFTLDAEPFPERHLGAPCAQHAHAFAPGEGHRTAPRPRSPDSQGRRGQRTASARSVGCPGHGPCARRTGIACFSTTTLSIPTCRACISCPGCARPILFYMNSDSQEPVLRHRDLPYVNPVIPLRIGDDIVIELQNGEGLHQAHAARHGQPAYGATIQFRPRTRVCGKRHRERPSGRCGDQGSTWCPADGRSMRCMPYPRDVDTQRHRAHELPDGYGTTAHTTRKARIEIRLGNRDLDIRSWNGSPHDDAPEISRPQR